MKNSIKHAAVLLIKNEEGQALVEYALLLFVFAVVASLGVNVFAKAWESIFDKIKLMRTEAVGMGP